MFFFIYHRFYDDVRRLNKNTRDIKKMQSHTIDKIRLQIKFVYYMSNSAIIRLQTTNKTANHYNKIRLV